MAEERFTLGYTDFQANAAEVFSELRQDSEFSDVTLACNDGPLIRAHKVVLAGCSPVFRKLFQQYNHPNPLIVMRGLRKSELENVINYARTNRQTNGQCISWIRGRAFYFLNPNHRNVTRLMKKFNG